MVGTSSEKHEILIAMDFKKQKPIYLQIAESLCQRVAAGEWKSGERVPAVREVAVSLGVNPNTIMRSYDYLCTAEIIEPRRGLGYYVADDAAGKILREQRRLFLEEEWPEVLQRMHMLGISLSELKDTE